MAEREEYFFYKKINTKKRFLTSFLFFFGVTLSILMLVLFLSNPPKNFPLNTTITISEGQSLYGVAHTLKEKGIIKSPFLFINYVIAFEGERHIKAGEYLFDESLSTLKIAHRLANGKYNIVSTTVTIPEGFNIFEIATRLAEKLPDFNEEEFIALAKTKEGYLFPDTYHFLPTTKLETIIKTMEENFDSKIQTIRNDVQTFGKPLSDITTMASILEEEAVTFDDRRVVAGILWTRLEIGMALQVDAAFVYVPEVDNRNTYELTQDDLKVESPFNTYAYGGLPPHPITNPGLESLRAAVMPIESEFLYYLSDKKGGMHYAETFEEHIKNKHLYLD